MEQGHKHHRGNSCESVASHQILSAICTSTTQKPPKPENLLLGLDLISQFHYFPKYSKADQYWSVKLRLKRINQLTGNYFAAILIMSILSNYNKKSPNKFSSTSFSKMGTYIYSYVIVYYESKHIMFGV